MGGCGAGHTEHGCTTLNRNGRITKMEGNKYIDPKHTTEYDIRPARPAETIRKAKDKFAVDLKELLEEFYNKTGIYITGINLLFHKTGGRVDKVVIEDIFLEEL